MLNNLVFGSPWFFTLLLLIPFLIWYEKNKKIKATIKYPSIRLLKLTNKKKLISSSLIIKTLRVLSLILLVVSLARPQIAKSNTEILSEGVNIVLGIDTSGSMEAIDMEINKDRVTRLEVVKKVVRDFVSKRTGDPTGLVVFGSEAFTQCPLTLDTNMLTDFVSSMEIGMAGRETAIGNALALSITRLKNLEAKSKIVILLTDGSNTAGKIPPDKATEIAQSLGIKVYTIGIGTTGKIPFIQDTVWGPQVVYGKADLDEQALKMIAEKTKGKYYRAKNEKELASIYNDIDKLEKSEVKIKNYMQYKEIFYYFLIPALILLLVEIVLSNTRFMKIP
jgi:Ca-activated chloride channel family protein